MNAQQKEAPQERRGYLRSCQATLWFMACTYATVVCVMRINEDWPEQERFMGVALYVVIYLVSAFVVPKLAWRYFGHWVRSAPQPSPDALERSLDDTDASARQDH